MNRLTIVALALLFSSTAQADGPQLSANPYAPNSTSNPYGVYGSPYSPVSANNPYAQGIPVIAPASHQAAPIVNVWATASEPTHTHDFSALSTLGAPESGLKFKSSAEPIRAAAVEAETVAPAPQMNIIDALDEIRRKASK